jgi:hypothetical protein
MRKTIIISAFSAAAALGAMPASAATVIDCGNQGGNSCIVTDTNVLLDDAENAATVTGTTNQGTVTILFTSMSDALLDASSGQASITGGIDGTLSQISFDLLNGAFFTTALFNLSPQSGNNLGEATFATVTTENNGVVANQTFDLSGNGSNFVGIQAGAGERITGVNISTNGNFESFRQLRLGGVSAVPEPTTWAMMLVGFGAVGYSMRRRKVSYGARQLV